MGVYVKGMEMPKYCERCPMYSEDFWKCDAKNREFKDDYCPWVDDRPDWCPLIEVPPHGDLIDQNALKLSILNLCFHDEVSILKNILGAVNNAPVIIEAEEET